MSALKYNRLELLQHEQKRADMIRAACLLPAEAGEKNQAHLDGFKRANELATQLRDLFVEMMNPKYGREGNK